MPYPIEQKVVIAVASSALFDLTESDAVFREKGLDAYRRYQRENETIALEPGVAFPLVRRLLRLNDDIPEPDAPVEVILLSRNDPDTGLRVFNSIEHHCLGISRAVFSNGGNPFRYMNAFNASLFLSASPTDVKSAIDRGLPAGRVFPTKFTDSEVDVELRIAFDFDGVIADDAAEAVFQAEGQDAFHEADIDHGSEPMDPGPVAKFFQEIARLQQWIRDKRESDPKYAGQLRTAIVTARNAPAHRRVVATLRDWGIEVDETFFLGGIEKARIMEVFRPHIFFDDQLAHIEGVAGGTPSAHIPFGTANEPSEELIVEAFEEYEKRRAKLEEE